MVSATVPPIETEAVIEATVGSVVPKINPPPPQFAELINMCLELGLTSTQSFGERDFDPKVSYWTVLKEKYMKENPDIITLDNYKK